MLFHYIKAEKKKKESNLKSSTRISIHPVEYKWIFNLIHKSLRMGENEKNYAEKLWSDLTDLTAQLDKPSSF